MTRVTLAFTLALAATSALAAEKGSKSGSTEKAAKSDCKAETTKVAKLTDQVEELQGKIAAAEAEVERLAGAGAGGEISVLGVMSSASDLVGRAFQQALDSTDIDEQAARHFETARAASVDAIGKVQAIDLSVHIDQLKSHDLYKAHVAPAMDAAAKKYDEHVRPAVDQHVSPALEKAKVAASQTMDTALPVLNQHKDTVSSGFSQIPAFLGSFEAKLGAVLAPLFDLAGNASPTHAKRLPSRPLDRFLLLLVLLVFSYYFVFFAKFVVALALRLAYSTTSVGIKVAVLWPLRIALKVLNVCAYFMTCFYCCGLCRRKGSVQDKKEKKDTKEPKKREKATVQDVKNLIDASKKKGKLDECVKLLCAQEKECKPMSDKKKWPEYVRDKMLDKETLKKAFSSYKEIDMKKL